MDIDIMDNMQAYHAFWSGFELKAYDETSVPDNATMPYITFESAEDDFNRPLSLTASVWYYSSSWTEVTAKTKEIADVISRGGKMIKYDGGAFWIRKSTPWAQRLSDENDDSVRRMILNIEVEFVN